MAAGARIRRGRIRNVPSYLAARDLDIEVPGLGPLRLDVAYGGNYYAIIEPQTQLSWPGTLQSRAAHWLGLVRNAPAHERAVYLRTSRKPNDQRAEPHSLDGCSHCNQTSTARNAVFYGEKAIDRSPCGTGTSARLAQWYPKGLLKPGQEFIHESYIGSVFKGTIEAETEVAGKPAILPGIEGWAMVTGLNTIYLDNCRILTFTVFR